jgi:type I restriction enzyme S subunit
LPGDLLLQRGNTIEYVGIAAIYEGPPNEFIYPDLMIRIRLVDSRLNGWVWRALSSPTIRDWIKARATGTAGTMPKINGETVRSIPIPLPPIVELEAGLALVETLLAVADDIEASWQITMEEARRLRQSVLAAAFSGKLVVQDPTDEPASVFLERARAAQRAKTMPLGSRLIRNGKGKTASVARRRSAKRNESAEENPL